MQKVISIDNQILTAICTLFVHFDCKITQKRTGSEVTKISDNN